MQAERRLSLIVGHGDFDLDLWHKVDSVLGAPIGFGVTFLSAEAADLGNGHAGDPLFTEGVFNVLEFEVTNHCFDFLHRVISLCILPGARRRRVSNIVLEGTPCRSCYST